MTIQQFCMYKTKVGELVVIKDEGYIRGCVWIDHEDIFVVPENYRERRIVYDEWGTINIVDEKGTAMSIPCHYVEVDSRYDSLLYV